MDQFQTTNYENWSEMTYDQSLTIADILNLKPGERIKVLVMDRNVWDIALDEKIRGKSLRPEDFFKSNWAIYVHEKDLKGKLIFSFEIDDLMNINEIDLNDICQPNYEFDINYKTCSWYPLTDGYLPASDPQGFSQFPWTEAKHWREFPTNTKVGWRGNMIMWSKLKDMPNIIYPFSKGIINAFGNPEDVTSKRYFNIDTDNEIVNSVATKFNFQAESHKWAMRWFCGQFRRIARGENDISDNEENPNNNEQLDIFPMEFIATVTETTDRSKKMATRYSILCEKDGEVENGMQRMGNSKIKRINS